jgi:alkanesulfonate monooxygenase SsuD/methylene tetrahydromethanopterin reductase-like flavin-dependent oxidoreductase (luciferase family)
MASGRPFRRHEVGPVACDTLIAKLGSQLRRGRSFVRRVANEQVPRVLGGRRRALIKPWLFEFFPAYSVTSGGDSDDDPQMVQERFRRFLDLWCRDEALGVEGIFFSEHHFGQAYSPSPNLVIAHLAALTTTLRLGVLGTVSPYATPWRVVEEFGILDQLTQGRLEMGLVSGIPPELAAVGITAEEAVERHEEIMHVLGAARSQRSVSHHGKHWSFDDLTFKPRLFQSNPAIWTSAVSARSAERAGDYGWKICTGFLSVSELTAIFDAYRSASRASGRDPSPDDVAVRRAIAIIEPGQDREVEKARVRTEFTKTFFDLPPEQAPRLADDEVIVGTADQVTAEIVRQCRALGCSNVLFSAPTADFDVHLRTHEIFGREVIPVLRETSVTSPSPVATG